MSCSGKACGTLGRERACLGAQGCCVQAGHGRVVCFNPAQSSLFLLPFPIVLMPCNGLVMTQDWYFGLHAAT